MKRIASLLIVAVVSSGLLVTGPSGPLATAQQTQPIPSANDDVRIVAGLLLAQELLDIASRTAVTPEGMLTLATQPLPSATPPWPGNGLTPKARAAASSSGLARSEVLLAPANKDFQVTPSVKIRNPLLQRAGTAQSNMLNTIRGAAIEAETAGQMELAYALASIYLTNGLFNYFNRGADNGLARLQACLNGEDIKLEISDPSSGRTTEFPVECSKYKSFQAVIATEVAPGAYSFLGPLVEIGCDKLLEIATTGKTVWLKLAAARAYVQGTQVFPGVFAGCIQPVEEQSEADAFLAAAQQAKANNQQELLQEILGFDYQVYDGAIEVYSSFSNRRGLARALEGEPTGRLEALAQDANNPEIGLAAYYELGNRWADKPEAELRSLMSEGPTPAVRRAATRALLFQLGRAFDVQCLQSLANGQQCQ